MRFLFLLISAHLIAATIGINPNHAISLETQKWLQTSLNDIDQHNSNNQCREIDEIPTAKELTKQIKEMREKLSDWRSPITTRDVETLFNAFSAYWKAALVRMKEEFPKKKEAYVAAKNMMTGGLTKLLPKSKSDQLRGIVNTFSDYRNISAGIMQTFLEKENDCKEKLTEQIDAMSIKLRSSTDNNVTHGDVETLFTAFTEYWDISANRTNKFLEKKKSELSNSGTKSIKLGDVETAVIGMKNEITEAKKAYDDAAKLLLRKEPNPNNSKEMREVLKTISAYLNASVYMMKTFPTTEEAKKLTKQIDEMREKLSDSNYDAKKTNDVKTWNKIFCDYWDATADIMEKFIKTTEDYKAEGHLKKAIETKTISKSNNAIYKKIEEDVNESVLQNFREAYQTVHLQSLQNKLLEIPKSFEFTKKTAKYYCENPAWLFAYAGVITEFALALPTDVVNRFRVGTNKAKQKIVQKKLASAKKTFPPKDK
ncbi:hypothetical protein GPALN_014881 [Globodera pallida]|nr:hypothetical protein GPALN_014881 [Globodera pallida]